jgi:acetolactate synthase-1/2/3 large subunit
MTATAGRVLVDALAADGIDRVFAVPGESYLGLLDALYANPAIDTVVCRHEAGAGFMALADARLTSRPGVALVSRGPGAGNAAIAVHTAEQDAVPFLLIVGQVPAKDLRRGAFQEIDYARMYGGIAKWTAEITDPGRMGETVRRAVEIALAGLAGPVVIAVPEDVLTASVAASPPRAALRVAPFAPVAPKPGDIAALRHLLAAAGRPLLLAGGALQRPGGREALRAFAEAWRLPVIVSFRRQDLFPNAHPLYGGDMGLANPDSQMAVLRQADLLLVLGARLSDITTQGYGFPAERRAGMTLAHAHPDPAVLQNRFAPDLGIACDPQALIAALGKPGAEPPGRDAWIARLKAERARIAAVRRFAVDDGIPFELVVDRVGRHLPADAIVTVDAGTFGAPVYRVVPFAPPQRLLAPISGAMGFGVPAAVAAGLREPKRPVVCFVGDGGFLMTGNELAVAKQRGLPLKVILSENGMYASIRIQQEREFPGRVVGTGFANPDFELIGRAFGFAVTRLRAERDLDLLPQILAAPGPQFAIVDTSVKAVLPGARKHEGE